MLARAESDSARVFREYFRENEFLSKTILACLSGARMGLIHEIKKYQKISWHCPFKWCRENAFKPGIVAYIVSLNTWSRCRNVKKLLQNQESGNQPEEGEL